MIRKEIGDSLTIRQSLAAQELALGRSVTEAAQTVGISRQKLSELKNHNTRFRAEVKFRRERLWRDNFERIRGLTSDAIDILAEGMRSDDLKIRFTAARFVLSLSGFAENAIEFNRPQRESLEYWRDATPQEKENFAELMRSVGSDPGDLSTLKVKALRSL